VFIVDQANNQLWSKIAKGENKTIRIPLDSGISGYVATTGRTQRIDEVYLDPRFNKEIDMQTNYRTKTILAVPIKDYGGTVLGNLH
jgi:adenylate cyclase